MALTLPHELHSIAPKGPKGQLRPADVIGNAVKVARIGVPPREQEFGRGAMPVSETITPAQGMPLLWMALLADLFGSGEKGCGSWCCTQRRSASM